HPLLTWRFVCSSSSGRESVQRQRRGIILAWGSAPGLCITSDPSAEGAIHSHAFSSPLFTPCRSPSAKSSFTAYLVRRIASPGSIPPHVPVRTPIWRQSAAIWGGEAFCVGGVSDHVHVVTTLPRTLSQAE